MLMRKKSIFALLALVLLVVMTACGSGQKTSAPAKKNATSSTGGAAASTSVSSSKAATPKKDSLVMAISNDVDGLDPQRTVSASTFEVTNNIFDTLVGVKSDGSFEPRLATDWKSSNNGLTWVFNLKPGVKFSNGRALTAADVVYSFNRLKADKSPRKKDFANITKVEATGNLQVTFTLKQQNAAFISSMALPWTAIVAKEADATMKTQPVGTGPYEVVKWTPQQSVVLKANPYYSVSAKPSIPNVTFKVIPNPTTLLASLKSGSVDIAGISGDQVAALKNNPNFTILNKPSNSVQVLALNNDKKPLNDVRVRQAIALAINKKEVIDGANFGFGTVIGSHMAPVSPYYVDETKVLSYNVQKAKELMKQAGYPNGFTMTLSLPQPYKMHIDSGKIIAQQLQQIGIKLNLQTVDWGKWVKDIYLGRKYDMTIIGHTGRLDPSDMLSRYVSTSGENYFNYKNATVDKDLKQAATELDKTKRMALYKQVQDILAKEVPAVYIQAPDTLIAMKKQVQGYQTFPIDIIDLKDISLTN